MITVYYSPHASSVDNEAGRASGHADVPLSEKGRQQALELGAHYQAVALDAVYCSDLQRATTTATLGFSGRKLPIIPDRRLREFDYGTMTQCPRSELKIEKRLTEPFPDGESITMAVQRIGNFLREVLPQVDGKTILVIGHVATKYGLEYWLGNHSLEDLVRTPWEWRDVPIWHYSFETRLIPKTI